MNSRAGTIVYDLRQLFRFVFGPAAIFCYGGAAFAAGGVRPPFVIRAALARWAAAFTPGKTGVSMRLSRMTGVCPGRCSIPAGSRPDPCRVKDATVLCESWLYESGVKSRPL